jgi:hypothetical protein
MRRMYFRVISSSAFFMPAIYIFYRNEPVIYSLCYLLTGVAKIVEHRIKNNLYLNLLPTLMMRLCFLVYLWRCKKFIRLPLFLLLSFFSVLLIYQFHLNSKELQKMDCIASVYYFSAKYFFVMFSNLLVFYYS